MSWEARGTLRLRASPKGKGRELAALSAGHGLGFRTVLEDILPRALVPPARQANRRTLLGGIVGSVVAVAGPRGEDEEDLRALLARDVVPLSELVSRSAGRTTAALARTHGLGEPAGDSVRPAGLAETRLCHSPLPSKRSVRFRASCRGWSGTPPR